MRLLTLLAVLTLPAAFLAGCTSSDPADQAPPPRDAAPGGPGGGNDGHHGSAPRAPQPAPPVEDAGEVQGPFEKSWRLDVASVAFREARVDFRLSGIQAGAPPTARVELQLLDPEGRLVKQEPVGVGASGDALSWTLRAADLPAPGTYTLKASSVAPGAVPSAGLAKYELRAEVLY